MELGVVACGYNLSTGVAEAGGLQMCEQPWLHNKLQSLRGYTMSLCLNIKRKRGGGGGGQNSILYDGNGFNFGDTVQGKEKGICEPGSASAVFLGC